MWQYEMISRIIDQHLTNQIYFLKIGGHYPEIPSLISGMYALDRRVFKCTSLRAIKKSDIALLGEYKSWEVVGDLLLRTGVKIINDNQFTHIINLTESPLPDHFYELVRAPVLSMFFSHARSLGSQFFGLLDYSSGCKVTYTGVQIEKPLSQENLIIYEAELSLDSSPSLCRISDICLKKTALFMPHVLANYGVISSKSLLSTSCKSLFKRDSEKLSFLEQYQFSFKLLSTVFTKIWGKLAFQGEIQKQWVILIAENKSEKPSMDFSSFVKIPLPDNEYWADPFLIEEDDKQYLFFEVLPFDTKLGHLSCLEILGKNSFTEPVKILSRPYHLSYPNVFEFEGEYYMVPETGDNARIELYRSVSFPFEWEYKYSLMENISAFDSTFIEYEGVWWLFATVAEVEGSSTTEELHLFYSDSPLSQSWVSHPANPINTFASSARPAGKIFKEGGELYRPSQNCAGSYGAGLNICKIVTLNKQEYKEEIVTSFVPDWDPSLTGLHTFNFNKKYTVIDAI